MGYAINDQAPGQGHCMILNIQFNVDQKTSTGNDGSKGPTTLHYYGAANTYGQGPITWGPATIPTIANTIWAYSGIKGGAATNAYWAYRYLYEDTPAQINANSQLLVTGVWIAMMMADNNTNSGKVVTPGTGASSIVSDNSYIPLDRCDMAGQLPLDANFASYTPMAGQTQTMPDGKVNFADIQFFVANYIAYYTKGIYSPYCDFNADGKINFADIQAFVHTYIQYYQIYNPLYVNPTQLYGNQGDLSGLGDGLLGSGGGLTTTLSLVGPAVLPSVGSSFNVTLHVDNVTGLWGWGTGMQWDPSVLNLTNINEGPFLASGGSTMFLNSMGDSLIASNGTLQDMGDCLCSSSVVNGNGDVATLTYQVLSNAPVNITLTGSELDTLDADSNIQVIPSTVNSMQIAANISGFFSAVQQGTSNSAWSIGPNPNPVNSTLAVDIQVNNASNIWGWSIPNITWNRNLLQLLNVTEGSFLVNNTGANPTVMCGNLPSQFDNVNGTITGGLSEAINGSGCSINPSGVVATLWFNVTGSGTAYINLSGATLYACSSDNTGTAANSNSAAVTVNVPSPYIFSDGFESGGFSNWATFQVRR